MPPISFGHVCVMSVLWVACVTFVLIIAPLYMMWSQLIPLFSLKQQMNIVYKLFYQMGNKKNRLKIQKMSDDKVNELSSSVNNDPITVSAWKLHESEYSDSDSSDEEYVDVNHQVPSC